MFFPNSGRRRNRYRSARSVQRRDVPSHLVTKWTRLKVVLVSVGTLLLATTTLLPIILIEQSTSDENNQFKAPVSLHNLLSKSIKLEEEYKKKGINWIKKTAGEALHVKLPTDTVNNNNDMQRVEVARKQHDEHIDNSDGGRAKSQHSPKKDIAASNTDPSKASNDNEEQNDFNNSEQQQSEPIIEQSPLARGVSGLPMSQTPALLGASRGHIECDENIDDIVYWNSPQGKRDEDFVSPFATPKNYYFTFEPDPGGWNNIRMSMEIIFVIAAATGRTLVLPPKAPMYLLGTGKENARSFGGFFPIDNPDFQKRVKVITMEEFIQLEGTNLLNLSDHEMKEIEPISKLCLHSPNSDLPCTALYSHLQKNGMQPDMDAIHDCLIFDKDTFHGEEVSDDVKAQISRFCGERNEKFYDKSLHEPRLIHWDASHTKIHRLLNHFYSYLYFTDPVIDNYYKRFVRDFLHYKDEIYCAAGKIIHALNADSSNGWSSLHIRRGDFQYKKVKLPAEEWYDNTKELWKEGEVLFIATDERNKTFFDPMKEHHELRFLDDYWDMAKLGDLDPNFLGMIDTIIASHGRAFSGTWFSTFTGYINRMRGYLGHPMKNSWYGWLPRKTAMQEYEYPGGNYGAREWPLGWVAIDGDVRIEKEREDTFVEDAVIQSRRNLPSTLSELHQDVGFKEKSLSRGITGRSMEETPALVGASRAQIECDINVDSLAYWNDPQGERDQNFESPFRNKGEEKYITFGIDRGGWNNVRMSMEIIFIIAAATGRTLVLPPKEPLYRLRADSEHVHRGFADFFPLHTEEFKKRVNIISMEEYVRREGGRDGRVPIPDDIRQNVIDASGQCDKRKASKASCFVIAEYLNEAGFVPDANAHDYCWVFDKDVYDGKELTEENKAMVDKQCGTRTQYFWTQELQDHVLIHFRGGDKRWRLLTHFYLFFIFTDPAIDNYYKRFVRDFLHYHDSIYCAAGKIVKSLQAEAMQRGFGPDENGAGGYSAMHVRRGDFQYKRVKIPAEEWYANTKEIWQPKEILYIATDERNKTFFDPIAKYHDLRFLDDYFDFARLGDLDPNYFGMIDTIVSSRARAFAGTWFSTFTGYINRMRGYHGMTMMDSWYSFLERKTKAHEWEDITDFAYAWEWPTGWMGIDADVVPSKDQF